MDDEENLSKTLRDLLDDHRNVITMLAEGFLECRKHIKVGIVNFITVQSSVRRRGSVFVAPANRLGHRRQVSIHQSVCLSIHNLC